jgi:hypothetical protein
MRVNAKLLAACLAGTLSIPNLAAAQSAAQAAPCPVAAAPADSTRAAAADVTILASVTIDELRFTTEPRGQVRVLGCGASDGLRVLERRNLPERVQPGVTYRDVRVSVQILGTLNAACIAALAGDTAAARGAAPGACLSIGGGSTSPPPSAAPPRE